MSRVLVQRGGDALLTALSTGVSHVRCVHCTHQQGIKQSTTHRVRDSPKGGEVCVGVGCGPYGGRHLRSEAPGHARMAAYTTLDTVPVPWESRAAASRTARRSHTHTV